MLCNFFSKTKLNKTILGKKVKRVVCEYKDKQRRKNPMLNYASELVKTAEGWRPDKYLDTLGNPTIGYGFNLNNRYIHNVIEKLFNITDIVTLTEKQGDKMVMVLLERLNNNMEQYKWYSECSEFRKAAILDMAYNMGVPTLLEFKNAISCMEKKEYVSAADNFMESLWSEQVGNRAKRDCRIIQTGTITQEILRMV